SKTLIKMPTDANPNLETRATVLFFTFTNPQDQIVAVGATDYPPTAGEFDPNQSVARAILGGTGKYMGARGQLTSTRNADGSYKQVFTLVKYEGYQCRIGTATIAARLESSRSVALREDPVLP